MYPVQNYFQVARENETVFRNILRDLKASGNNRQSGCYVPENLETEAPLENIFEKYSRGKMFPARFTVTNFTIRISNLGRVALIEFENVSFLSGGGARLNYRIKASDVEYLETEFEFSS